MLTYVLVPERDLPPDAGFIGFGQAHLIMLAVLLAASAGIVVLGCRMDGKHRRRLLKCLATEMLLLELGTDIILIYKDAFSVGYLPLHLCNIAMFLCLWFAWWPSSDLAGQLIWSLCFPAGIAALLFPDWTNMPILQFQSLSSFVYHAVMVQFSLVSVISGMAKPRLQSVWKTMVFLMAMAAVVYWINLKLKTNFMFLNWPLPGTPLMLCAALPGRWGYLLGYTVLTAGVLVLLNLPFSLGKRRLNLRAKHREAGS